MKKKILFVALILVGLVLTGCQSKRSEADIKAAADFKKEYESLNGKTNSSGKKHRTITIDEDNPYEEVDAKDVVDKIKDKDTFYLYIGDPLCPWCRSVIEKSIEVAKEKGIDKIYYIKIWDKDGNEVFRDKYELKKNKPTKTVDGTDEYYSLLKTFNSLLDDYTLTNDKDKTVKVGEKRIYAPSYFYIEGGKAKKMTTAISDKQKDARGKLTDKILDDEEKSFEELFDN